MLRENDEWIVDFAGKKMLQGTYPLVRKLFPIHPGTPLKELVFNTKQLIDMACGLFRYAPLREKRKQDSRLCP